MNITKREKEVLLSVAYGSSSKEIAEQLALSNYTIHSHRKNLLRKMNANNSAALICKSFEYGILVLRHRKE